jgi:signal transduction histidine kinase
MILAVGAIGALAYWDAARESAEALEDFGRAQQTVAKSVASSVRARLLERRGEPLPPARSLLDGAAAAERPGALVVLLQAPGEQKLRTTAGAEVGLDVIGHALDADLGFVRLSRAEAAQLGLPSRMALAGLARVEARGRWGVAVVASAERPRDRERRSRTRVILAVALAGALVLGFGGLALRQQRKELLLARELELVGVRQQADERLARANKTALLGALAIGVTHEISTPLNVISARAEQLRQRLGHDERNARAAQIILEQTEHIDQVIRGLLGLARGAGPAGQWIAPAAILDGACRLVEHRFADARVALRRSAPAELPPVHGDLRLLEHALVNLLLNARDACSPGGTVELAAAVRDGHLVLAVSDDGVGISAQDIDQAMEPFFTTKAAGQGTGLGLTIAREIVASHRGRLLLTPLSPHGTRAEIELPLTEIAHE